MAAHREPGKQVLPVSREVVTNQQTAARANARLTEGDEDWNAGELGAIADYGEAWDIVTPQH